VYDGLEPELAPEVAPEVLVFPGEEAAEDMATVVVVRALRACEWDLGREYGVLDRLGGCEELFPERFLETRGRPCLGRD
jgi:hypothetical protein